MMKIKTISLFGTMLLSFFAWSNAAAAPECYQWSDFFSKERFVLDIEEHSDLSRNQRAFSVHGKHLGVCGYGTIAAVTGTIVRATSPLPVTDDHMQTREHILLSRATSPLPITGARMGLRTHSVRAAIGELGGIVPFCKEVTLDCTLEQSVTPKTWTCIGRNEWDVFLPGARGGPHTRLTKLSPQDESCKIFEDIEAEVPTTPEPGDEFSGVFGMPQQQ